jgi:hypothetical protein
VAKNSWSWVSEIILKTNFLCENPVELAVTAVKACQFPSIGNVGIQQVSLLT